MVIRRVRFSPYPRRTQVPECRARALFNFHTTQCITIIIVIIIIIIVIIIIALAI